MNGKSKVFTDNSQLKWDNLVSDTLIHREELINIRFFILGDDDFNEVRKKILRWRKVNNKDNEDHDEQPSFWQLRFEEETTGWHIKEEFEMKEQPSLLQTNTVIYVGEKTQEITISWGSQYVVGGT